MAYETLVSRDLVQQHLDDPTWRIFDCRFDLKDTDKERRAYAQSHLPNAQYAHLDEDLSGPITPQTGRHPLPDFRVFTQKLRQWGVGNQTQVVIYDDAAGSIATRLWWMLRYLGHHSVALMDGGFPHWLREQRPVSAALPTFDPSRFLPRSALSEAVDTEQLVYELQTESCVLLDARAAERFRGEVEPIDPVAGHIPGAINRPYTLNLDEEGNFLPAATLRAALERQMGTLPGRSVIHMCGSGVTACHNLIAMEHAGFGGSRLYGGSWSEWIRDPARPIARL